MALNAKRYSTLDGGTVDVHRRGYLIDLHVRNAAGRTVATVEMNEDDARALLLEMAEVGVLL